MRCSCAMMSARVTSLVEEEGADVDGSKREGGAADPNYLDLNCALLHLTIAASMTHI